MSAIYSLPFPSAKTPYGFFILAADGAGKSLPKRLRWNSSAPYMLRTYFILARAGGSGHTRSCAVGVVVAHPQHSDTANMAKTPLPIHCGRLSNRACLPPRFSPPLIRRPKSVPALSLRRLLYSGAFSWSRSFSSRAIRSSSLSRSRSPATENAMTPSLSMRKIEGVPCTP